jgi:hypothetical protein
VQAVGCPAGTLASAYCRNRRAASVAAIEESQLAQTIVMFAEYPGSFKRTITKFLDDRAAILDAADWSSLAGQSRPTAQRPNCAELPRYTEWWVSRSPSNLDRPETA